MKTRPLTWDDVNANISTRYAGMNKPRVPWTKRNGYTRVYARLKMACFVGIELWIWNPDLTNPATQAVILLKLHRLLRKCVHKLKTYEVPPTQ